ncbi:hypothetical protein HMPREF3099_03465, partial [Kytococcus sp. HMSC28H12]
CYTLRSEEPDIPYAPINAVLGYAETYDMRRTQLLDDARSESVLEALGVITEEMAPSHSTSLTTTFDKSITVDLPPETAKRGRYPVRKPEHDLFAARREGVLVEEYLNWLGRRAEAVCTHVGPYKTDLLVDGELIEAKSDAGDPATRQALGQILHYCMEMRRHGREDFQRIAILLPQAPSRSVTHTCLALGASVIYKTADGFDRFDASDHARETVQKLLEEPTVVAVQRD